MPLRPVNRMPDIDFYGVCHFCSNITSLTRDEDGETLEAMKLAIEHSRPSKLLSEIRMHSVVVTNHIND